MRSMSSALHMFETPRCLMRPRSTSASSASHVSLNGTGSCSTLLLPSTNQPGGYRSSGETYWSEIAVVRRFSGQHRARYI